LAAIYALCGIAKEYARHIYGICATSGLG